MADYSGANLITANRFYVGMENVISAAFSECEGLDVEIEYESFNEGGVNNQRRILLGQPKFSEVKLKRGMSDDMVFWDWIAQVMKMQPSRPIERRNVNILLFNQAGETMQCWTLIGAVPVKWSAPRLSADATEIAIEELSLAYEGIQVKKSGTAAATVHQGRKNGYFSSN
jgi:phage tail-like protein